MKRIKRRKNAIRHPRPSEMVNLNEFCNEPLFGPSGNGRSEYHGGSFDFDGTLVDSERKKGIQHGSWLEAAFSCVRDTPTARRNESAMRADITKFVDDWFSHVHHEPLVPGIAEILWRHHCLPEAVYQLIPPAQRKLRNFGELDPNSRATVRKALDEMLCNFRRPFMIGEVKANPKAFVYAGSLALARKHKEKGKKFGLNTASIDNIACPLMQIGFGYQRSELFIPRLYRVYGNNVPNKAIGHSLLAYRMKLDPTCMVVVDDRIRDVRAALNVEELKMQVNHRFFDPDCDEWTVPGLNKAAFRKFIEHIRGPFRGIVIAGHDADDDRLEYVRDQFNDCPPNSFRVVPGVNFLTL